jgi:hypothetical protein
MVSVAIYWGERRWNLMKSGCYSVVGPRLKTRSETSAKFLVFPGYFWFFNYNDRVLVLSQSNACVLPWGCDTLVGNRNRRKFWIRLQPTCEYACHSVPFFVYGISLKITPLFPAVAVATTFSQEKVPPGPHCRCLSRMRRSIRLGDGHVWPTRVGEKNEMY